MSDSSVVRLPVKKISSGIIADQEDFLAGEEPLEIRIAYGEKDQHTRKNIAVTMRTPGNDDELAAGFLFSEGILPGRNAMAMITAPGENIIEVEFEPGFIPELKRAERNFYTTSSCGVCGKTSIDSVRTAAPAVIPDDVLKITIPLLYSLPESLRKSQAVFGQTGGLHASALFDLEGNLLLVREDVGRHNALDKLLGKSLVGGELPLDRHILLLSGRASFELVQKAAMAGIKIIAAIGAPSSLAVELAREFGITLAGFLRDENVNIYCGSRRVTLT